MTEVKENIDDSFEVEIDKEDNKGMIDAIVPFFKALDVMRKEGVINSEDSSFKRDIEFEKLIADPNFNPENLTAKEIGTLEMYMNYIHSIILDDDKDKLMKAIGNISKNSKKKKQRWRDIKKGR